jgi:pantothenate kinase type III
LKVRRPRVVVDSTATTFDDFRKGEYLRHHIARYRHFARAFMAHRGAFPGGYTQAGYGTNTVGSIQAGLFFGHLGLVDGILSV